MKLTIFVLILMTCVQASALDNRMCIQGQIGYNFMYHNVKRMFNHYIARWNIVKQPEKQTNRAQNFKNHLTHPINGINFKIAIHKTQDIEIQQKSKSKSQIQFTIIGVSTQHVAKGENIGQYAIVFEQKIIIDIKITKGKNHQINFVRSHEFLDDKYECHSQSKTVCQNMKEKLKSGELIDHFMPQMSDETFFDQPTSQRNIMGWLNTFNKYSQLHASKTFVQINSRNLLMMVNCNDRQVQNAIQNPVAKDSVQFKIGQNALDFMNLQYFQFEFQDILNAMMKSSNLDTSTQMQIHQLGFGNIKNQIGPVQNKEIFEQIDFKKVSVPSLRKTGKTQKDKYDIAELETWKLSQNLFIQVYDKSSESDITIIPIKIDLSFALALIPGPHYKFGPTQMINIKDIKVKTKMQNCQTVWNVIQDVLEQESQKYISMQNQVSKRMLQRKKDLLKERLSYKIQLDYEPTEEEKTEIFTELVGIEQEKPFLIEQDDEDFDEDDGGDFDDGDEKKSLKKLTLGPLICSIKAKVDEVIQSGAEKALEEFIQRFKDKSPGSENEWLPLENRFSYGFAHVCSGIQTKEPVLSLEEDNFVYTAKIDTNIPHMYNFCDQDDQELLDQDPRLILMQNQTQFLSTLDFTSKHRLTNSLIDQNWTSPAALYNWIDTTNSKTGLDLNLESLALKSFTSYFYLDAFCQANLPDYDRNICINSFIFFKPHSDYEKLNGVDKTILHKEYTDLGLDNVQDKELIGRIILYVGLLLYVLELIIPQNMIIQLFFWGSIIMAILYLNHPFLEQNPSFTSYFAWAIQLYHGQTDYSSIISHEGQITNPIGHVWHYFWALKLHMISPDACWWMKSGTIFVHLFNHFLIIWVAYKYFANKRQNAQMIVFALAANFRVSKMHQHLYDDSIVTCYINLCLIMLFQQHIYVAAFFLSLSLGVKTSAAFYIMPAFIGTIQWHNGTRPALRSIVIIVLIQILMALPIVFGPASYLMGFDHGANTSIPQYLSQSGLIPGYEFARQTFIKNAEYNDSIYWKFISETTYNWNICYTNTIICWIVFNCQYFLNRRENYQQCLQNLTDFDATNWNITFSQQKKIIEMVLIMYVGSCIMMPGGTESAQLVYIEWVPMLIMIAGDLLNSGVYVRNGHVLLSFKIYHDIFPAIVGSEDKAHHVFLLALILYLARNTGKFSDWMVEKKKGELITLSYINKLDVETKYDYHSKVVPKTKAYYEFYNQ